MASTKRSHVVKQTCRVHLWSLPPSLILGRGVHAMVMTRLKSGVCIPYKSDNAYHFMNPFLIGMKLMVCSSMTFLCNAQNLTKFTANSLVLSHVLTKSICHINYTTLESYESYCYYIIVRCIS